MFCLSTQKKEGGDGVIPGGRDEVGNKLFYKTYHHTTSNGDSSAAVRVRYNIPITYAQECNGYQPHGV